MQREVVESGLGTPVKHFGCKRGIKASIIRWSDGSLSLRVKGNRRMYPLLEDREIENYYGVSPAASSSDQNPAG